MARFCDDLFAGRGFHPTGSFIVVFEKPVFFASPPWVIFFWGAFLGIVFLTAGFSAGFAVTFRVSLALGSGFTTFCLGEIAWSFTTETAFCGFVVDFDLEAVL
ncbi:MAG TPA: hypothetical protein VLD65_01465, partial [Anaerolineales bacterium]|nr:hypothetical protein [Anaerolineales bacterium]